MTGRPSGPVAENTDLRGAPGAPRGGHNVRLLVLHKPERPPANLSFPRECEVRYAPADDPLPGPWDAVVHWGCTEVDGADDLASIQFNPPEALRRAADHAYVAALWRAHGISVSRFEPYRRKRYRGRRYRLHICDLRVLWVARVRKGRFKVVHGVGSKVMQRIRWMAVRCLYVLGLHFGMIEVAALSRKKIVPLNFDPFPRLTKRMGGRYGKAVALAVRRRQLHPEQVKRPALIGADIEFIMKRPGGKIAYASHYFSRYGRIGHDQQGSRRARGRFPIAELRPAPAEQPTELIAGIQELLKRAARRAKAKGMSWQAGSLPAKGYPIGGHIHISRVDLTTELLRALDNYLAVPVAMLENAEKARRRRPEYGYLGEFRWKGYGGFEYRTLSSWIVAPHIALAVVTLAKLIIDHYPELPQNNHTSVEHVRAFYKSDKEVLRVDFESVWRDITRLDVYPEVAEQLEVIPNLVREGRQWLESGDIRARWGLIRTKRRRRR